MVPDLVDKDMADRIALRLVMLGAVIGVRAGRGIGAGAAKATAAMLPFLALGNLVGERLHKKATPAVFSTLVFAMLLATGVVMLFF